MTTPEKQANALRALASIIEGERIPSREYDSVPLHTSLYFRTEADRQIAYDFFKKNHTAHIDSANNYTGSIGGDYLYGGVSVALIVPSLITEED